MGQKVNPFGMRLGIINNWSSKWYVDKKNYADHLIEDLKIKDYFKSYKFIKGLKDRNGRQMSAEISNIEIIRQPERINVILHTARPAIVLGEKGHRINSATKYIQNFVKDKKIDVKIREVKRPEINAQLVSENIARQLAGKGSFRRVLKRAISSATKLGIGGIKVKIAGRLGGAEMARTEEYKEGRIPLHTFRANIDYGFAESLTTYGKIGVRVWIFHKEIFKRNKKEDAGIILKKKSRKNNFRAEK